MFGIPTPYVLAACLFVGFVGGYRVKSWQCDAAYAKALEQAAKEKTRMEGIINAKSAQYEELSAHAAEKSVVTTNTVKEIYRNTPAPPANCAPPTAAVGVLFESLSDTDTAPTTGKSGK